MTNPVEHDLDEWIEVWKSDAAASATDTGARANPAEGIRDRVQRRERFLAWSALAEALLGLGFLAFLVRRAILDPDLVEKLAMSLLAAITVAVMVFSWENWRRGVRDGARDTKTFLELARDRSRRLERASSVAWLVLTAQVAVFIPWTWYQLHGSGHDASFERAVFGWSLLVTLTLAAAAAILFVRRWIRRDADAIEDLRRALLDDDA
jgi:hypothetical protein